MNLIIDIGNTIAKMAVFDGGRIVEVVYDSNLTLERLPEVCRTYTIEKAIVATVIEIWLSPFCGSMKRLLFR